MSRPAEWALFGLLVGGGLPLAAGAEAPLDAVDLELLEFLGEWETDDGEWIDPLVLEEMPGGEDAPARDGTEVGDD
ncbi:MAG: hypothetical protein ACE5FG_05650 [Myxococcota bacterium]